MKFKVEIDLDNAAFDGGQRPLEIARILKGLAKSVVTATNNWPDANGWNLFDLNGNSVGKAKITE